MTETAADLFVERLIEWGVDTVFGLPGDGINGFMESLRTRQDRVRYIHVRHEEVGAVGAGAARGEKPETGPARFIAEPAALGLAAFALSTMALSFINLGVLDDVDLPVVLGLRLAYGGSRAPLAAP